MLESPHLNRHRVVEGGGSSPAASAVQTRGGGGYGGHFRAAQGFRYYGQRGVEG